MKTTILLSLTLLISVSVFGQNYQGKQKDIDKILANTKQFSQYYVDGEIAKLAKCYTTDGKLFPSNGDIIEGTEAIEKKWQIEEGSRIARHKVTPSEITIVKNTAYDYGYYEGDFVNAAGEKYSFKGKYVIVWKKVDKDWKIYLDIWNSL